jgi:glutamate synthase domain-containing protein 3
MEEGRITTTREINKALKQQLRDFKTVRIEGILHQHCIAVGIEKDAKIIVNGNAGDLFASLNNGAKIVLNGNAGRFTGDSMTEGEIVINGNAGNGAGTYMSGGVLVVKGSAGGKIGQYMKNGIVVIEGDARDFIGLYQTGGSIVITGNVGSAVGHWKVGGNIYIGGKRGELGYNSKEVPLEDEDRDFLQSLFKKYDIKSEGKKFKKITTSNPRPDYTKHMERKR